MSFIATADEKLHGDSEKWKNWESHYEEPNTCIVCKDMHGKIYPFSSKTYIPEHFLCRCKIVPMRTKEVGTVTQYGWNGADAWLMYQGVLPNYYVTKKEALAAGWDKRIANLADVLPGKMIGGDLYKNNQKLLPKKRGRIWREADFDYFNGYRNNKRIMYSNDGLIFISKDHAQTFYELVE